MPYKPYLEKILIFGLYFLLLTPLFYQRSLMHPLVTLKTVIFQALVEILFAIYLYLAIFYKEYRLRFRPLVLLLGLLVVWLFITSFFGVNWHRSFWSIPERTTGLALWLHLLAFLVMLTNAPINWRNYFSFSVVVSFFVALFPVVHQFFPNIFFDAVDKRIGGTIGNALFLTAYLLPHIFLGLWLCCGEGLRAGIFRSWRWILGVIAIFDLVVLLLTQTRSGLVALGAAFLVLAYLTFRSHRLYRSYAAVVLVLLVLFAGFFWLTKDLYPFWQEVPFLKRFTQEELALAGPRLIALQSGWASFKERPLLGWGWESFYILQSRHYRPEMLGFGLSETFFDKPHNVFMEYAVTGGLVGLLLYLALVYLSWRRSPNIWFQALFVGYYVQAFFGFDTLNSLLIFIPLLAFLDKRSTDYLPANGLGRRHWQAGEISTNIQKTLPAWSPIILAGLLLVSLILVDRVNYRYWLGSNRQYHALNYYLNKLPEEGLLFYNKALTTDTFYIDYIRRDLAPALVQFWQQGLVKEEGDREVRRAVAEFQKVIAHHPNIYNFRVGLADMLNWLHDFDASYADLAETELKAATELSPSRQATYHLWAKIKRNRGDLEAALNLIKKAIALDSKIALPHFYHALLLFDGNQAEAAYKELKEAEARGWQPQNNDEARVMGGFLADAGHYAEAVDYFRLAIAIDEDDQEARMKLGLTYFFLGKKDLAKTYIGGVLQKTDITQSPQYLEIKAILEELGL